MNAAERGPLRVVGRYAIYNEIAAGGMATVHIGRLLGPVGFARTVAVKRLHPQFAKDPEFVSMFLDEARLAARVQHPNVVATIDVVATEGELFLIMDYVRGESLSKLLRSTRKHGERMPPRIAASIVCGFLHGLHAAHEAKDERGTRINLVHRDVSPQNVLVGADGIPRVLDFGIAKAAGRIQVTRDGQIKGKLAYMPPEQLSGRDVTRAVDVYAAAVVMWESLTGDRLFKGETEAATLGKILRDPVVPPSAVVAGLTKAFDTPLLKALSREPGKRHATARELAFDLEKCVGVATASEVGEWVENRVGAVLSAREDQIAEIESNSAGLRVSPSGRPEPESLDTDSEVQGVPSSRHGTLLGVGAPSGSLAVPTAYQRRFGGPTPMMAMGESDRLVAGDSDRALGSHASGLHASSSDEHTGSQGTRSRFTASLSLPVDKRLPILASLFGLSVLIAIVGVVLLGRGSSGEVIRKTAGSDAVTGSEASAKLAPATQVIAAPAPPPQEGVAPSADVQPHEGTPLGSATAVASTGRTPVPSIPAVVHAAPRSISTPVPSVHADAPTNKVTTKHCDPPYTLDSNGRKKYKLECL